MSDFGGLIRDAREKLGLSPHRVAELIGRGTGIVKAWERGRAVPTDPFVITSLAAVLAVEETRLFRAAGIDPPGRQPTLTIEQELATIAPPRPAPEEGTETAAEGVSRGVMTQETPSAPKPQPETATSAVTEYVPRQPVAPAAAPPPAHREPRSPRVASEQAIARSYMDDPEERWSYRLRAAWTAAGVGALGILMLWAGSRALDAFGDVWDSLLSGL